MSSLLEERHVLTAGGTLLGLTVLLQSGALFAISFKETVSVVNEISTLGGKSYTLTQRAVPHLKHF